jgi:hypothetical protein
MKIQVSLFLHRFIFFKQFYSVFLCQLYHAFRKTLFAEQAEKLFPAFVPPLNLFASGLQVFIDIDPDGFFAPFYFPEKDRVLLFIDSNDVNFFVSLPPSTDSLKGEKGIHVIPEAKRGTLLKIIKKDNKGGQKSSSKILRGLERLFWFPLEPIARRRYFVPAALSSSSFEG